MFLFCGMTDQTVNICSIMIFGSRKIIYVNSNQNDYRPNGKLIEVFDQNVSIESNKNWPLFQVGRRTGLGTYKLQEVNSTAQPKKLTQLVKNFSGISFQFDLRSQPPRKTFYMQKRVNMIPHMTLRFFFEVFKIGQKNTLRQSCFVKCAKAKQQQKTKIFSIRRNKSDLTITSSKTKSLFCQKLLKPISNFYSAEKTNDEIEYFEKVDRQLFDRNKEGNNSMSNFEKKKLFKVKTLEFYIKDCSI